MNGELIRIDGVDWLVEDEEVTPLCPVHRLEMYPLGGWSQSTNHLVCDDCNQNYRLPRYVAEEQDYIVRKLKSKSYKKMRLINLDDESIPIAKEEIKSEDNRFFVTSQLMESKVGLRLVVYAGERGKKDKTQIFVEPAIKRISFDQKDLHPSDVFLKLEGTFDDGTKTSIEKKKNGS